MAGVSDLLFYGGKDVVAARGKEGLAYSNVTKRVLGDLANTTFVSRMAEIDYDNDGDFDLFVTREDHPFEEKTFFDPENDRFAFRFWRKRVQYDELRIEGDFKLENLQMAYPHFDVFVGAEKRKLEFEVERHGHKDFVLTPEEAEGWPSDTSEKGLYVGHLGEGVWRIEGETQAGTAGVVLNVKSRPEVTVLEDMPALLLENREGVFVDVTAAMGIAVPEQTTGIAVGDFDNNGWSDLFIVRYGNPAMQNEQVVYLNRDGTSFARSDDHGVVSRELGAVGAGADAFDYDEDGDLDLIYGNERGRWHLFTNNGLAADRHNYIVVKVGRSPSGKASALGAVVTLEANGQTYRRVVGSTAAGFSQSANTHLHVGLGRCDTVDRAMVRWSNGETEQVLINAVNQSVDAGLTK